MADEARRLVARLAVAVMAADRRVGPTELAALEGLGMREMPAIAGLERLGLGALSTLAFEEARRSESQPPDLDRACALLRETLPRAIPGVLAALSEIAASDGPLVPAETRILTAIAKRLGMPANEARLLFATTVAAELAPGEADLPIGRRRPVTSVALAQARRVLGVQAGARREAVDAAYRRLVERYNPAKVSALGGDFAALAVRRLAGITDAYDTVLAAMRSGHRRGAF
jgi:DnaJ-domain-containing protein 1